MTVSDQVDRLDQALEAEERLYVELRDLLQQERTHLVDFDAESLERLVETKELLAEEARLLEDSRLSVATRLAEQLGLASEPITLSRLCEALGSDASRLADRHSRLVALLGAIRELSEANASFAREGLGQVRETIRLLGRLLPSEPTYRGATSMRPAPDVGRLVRGTA
ncbi:MAG: flagellar protein FlgN [Myxococcota bacterium]|nr:flagellar protein FlgN [Myxococcota bacterium]